jgi:DNA-binding GntR family transcriptional regulator
MSSSSEENYVDSAYGELRSMVRRYAFRPCQRLDIGQLASMLHVSRTPVREALNRLLNEALLVQVRNRGFYCRPIDRDELRSLLQMRGLLSAATFRLLLTNADFSASLDELVGWWQSVISGPDLGAGGELHCEDELIRRGISLLENPEMLRVFSNLEARLYFFFSVYHSDDNRRRRSLEQARSLLEALRARDNQRCQDCIDRASRLSIDALPEVLKDAFAQLYAPAEVGRRVLPANAEQAFPPLAPKTSAVTALTRQLDGRPSAIPRAGVRTG